MPVEPRWSTAPSPSVVALPEVDEPTTVLDFLDRRFPRVGREVWRRRIQEGKVLTDEGCPIDLETPYRPRTRLRYFREVASEPEIPFEAIVLFRNDDLMVVDKPHFLPVVPSGRYVNECLLYRLRRQTGLAELAPVHRLDRATAGLVLCSLRAATRPRYVELFARRRVAKEYLAVARVPEPPQTREWLLRSRLVRGEPRFRVREVAGEVNAITRIELEAWREGLGRFRLLPETGKTHQLRFHLASLGYPILHERAYPRLLPEAPLDLGKPLQLLARRLSFRDPVTGEAMGFTSERRLAAWPEGLLAPAADRDR